MSSRSISLIMSRRVLYDASDEIIELMHAKVFSVFMAVMFYCF